MWIYCSQNSASVHSIKLNHRDRVWGNPFQCSCLENPRDGGAWWTAVYGVAQNRIRLKRLSSSSSKALTPGASQMALAVKNLPASAGDTRDVGSIPVLGRFPGGGNVALLQYSCLGSPMDRGAWRHGVTKESDTTKHTQTVAPCLTSLVLCLRGGQSRHC